LTVIVLTAVPPGLRGHLTRWLIEISPGVFVGHISSRVRELTWQRIINHLDNGRALMVHTAPNEQRLAFKFHGHDWEPLNYEGISLMLRRTAPDLVPAERQKPSDKPTLSERPGGGTAIDSEPVWKRRNASKKLKS
jgi:CRISPR-associated protein Cas2